MHNAERSKHYFPNAMSTTTTTPAPFVFNEANARSDDKTKRQSMQRCKWAVVDLRSEETKTRPWVLNDRNMFVMQAGRVNITVHQLTPEDITENTWETFGVVFYITDNGVIAVFEGSVYSNFEPCEIRIESNDKVLVCKSVEHYFQLSKVPFVLMATPDMDEETKKLLLQRGRELLMTAAPTYMIKIAREVIAPKSDMALKFQDINVDILEYAVFLKSITMTEMDIGIRRLKQYYNFAGDVEFWEANKYDPHYGVGLNLFNAHKLIMAGESHGKANHMGRILSIHLGKTVSQMTPESRKRVLEIEAKMLDLFGEVKEDDPTDNMDCVPEAKRLCGRTLSN